ncbi:MAG: S8 family serine peptidase [Oligoflexia bacterium]|nr:S8 family serine peptidase [Oligoflexia bacterium]
MGIVKTAIVVMLALSTGVLSAAASEYKQNEIIVKYKDGAVRNRLVMNSLYSVSGVTQVKRYKGIMKGFEQLILQDNVKVQDAIYELQRSGLVEYAQPNYILRAYPIRTNEGEIPCIPGYEIPGCTPIVPPGDGGGGGGEMPPIPCLIPGIPFPPGCTDDGGSLPIPGQPGQPGNPGGRPEVLPPPAEVNPPVADPDIAKTYGMTKISAIEAWKLHRGDKAFVVADIDTGIDYNHEDLAFNIWRNPNPTQNDVVGFDFVHNDGLPYDDNQHGTHTTGSIGAVGGNGKAISGVVQNVSIMGLKFLSGEGSGTTADAIRAIDYAVEHGAKVLSNSWGGKGDDDNKALYAAIERAKEKDVLFIAAAGNDGTDNDGKDPAYPAAFDNDNLIAVAATDEKDSMAFFSNYGKKTTHLAAPGVNIYSTTPGNKYASFSGTSMACPHVAGAAALLWSKNPTWNYKKVKKVLMETVDVLPALQGKTVTGGRINVLKALRYTE